MPAVGVGNGGPRAAGPGCMTAALPPDVPACSSVSWRPSPASSCELATAHMEAGAQCLCRGYTGQQPLKLLGKLPRHRGPSGGFASDPLGLYRGLRFLTYTEADHGSSHSDQTVQEGKPRMSAGALGGQAADPPCPSPGSFLLRLACFHPAFLPTLLGPLPDSSISRPPKHRLLTAAQ